MIKKWLDDFKGMERDFLLFLFVVLLLGVGQSVDAATLNNFLKDRFDILIMQRTLLEIPRELPGLLVFVFLGFMFALGDIRIAALANLAAAVGMFLLGIIPPNFFIMLMVVFIYSSGQHLFMPLFNTIGMSFAEEGHVGKKLGQINAVLTFSFVVSGAGLWLLFRYLHISYTVSFTLGAAAFLISAILLFKMNSRRTVAIKHRFVFKKEYRLYYWLNILYGARKQIFITFAPWVLVDVFKQKVDFMTMLFFIVAVLGIFFRPFVGYLIDRLGEKIVLTGEAAVLFFLCLGYAYAEDLFPGMWAIVVVSIIFILDISLDCVNMARATYIKKIAVSPEDVSPTLSVGVSLDHIVSMFIPVVGGYVWYAGGPGGYKYVFLGAAVIALLNFFSARNIKTERQAEESAPASLNR